MTAVLIKLECITNMHVGNGEANYNIIDNEVEKDPITGYPTINSSGIKGALREYFSQRDDLKGYVKNIFGEDAQGTLKFLSADMIARPMRASKGDKPYYMVGPNSSIDRLKSVNDLFLNGNGVSFTGVKNDSVRNVAEGIALEQYCEVLDEKVYIVNEDKFKNVDLPVLARNKLDNGVSKNLWYEEVVPYRSIFCFAVVCNDNDVEMLNVFKKAVKDQIIQFGGNATIGYGLCKVSVIGGCENE